MEHRRVRTPTILQLEAVECGAATLGMVLGYHGRIVPLAELRRECGVSRDGSKASNMVKAARRYGMEAKGFSKRVADLYQLAPPFIVFWNFNHFVTFEGFDDKGRVFINDPASGHRIVTMEEFERAFTGVVLVMKPGEGFEKGGRKPSVFAAIAERLVGSGAAVAYCILAGFLLVVPGLAIPAFNQIFIDNVILAQRVDWLRPLILAMILALVGQALLRFLQMRYLRRLRIRLSIQMSTRYMWHMLSLPASFYAQRFAGEVANRSQLNDKLAELLSGRLAQTAIDVVMVGFYGALMFYYDVVLTLIGIAFAAINILVLRYTSRRRVEANMRVLQEYGKAQGTAMAGLQGIETIKAGGMESGFFGRWAGYYAKATNARQELELSSQALSFAPSLLTSLTTTAILVVGGLRIISGDLSIGMLVAFQSLMSSFLSPINNLLFLGSTFQELQGDLERVNDVLDHPALEPPEHHDLVGDDGERIVRLNGYVELRGVTFGYSPLEKPLLEGFDLTIKPGSRVALVGGSGSGKTTIAKLISGEYEPWQGEILFDGIARGQIPNDVLVNSFATVDQDIQLFGGTVRDNLTLWDPTVPDANLQHACEDAAIMEAVRELPAGFDSVLLEGGGNLSGGQRQRLEIARALVHNPSVLVMDEATSALDAETEAVVMERLRMRGCTAVLVAHRLSTIRDADEIIVLSKGKVLERGTHAELWAAQGEYAQLMRADQESDVAVAESATP
ncbi:MAG: NHLP family bacteriocin export ABC transporter peptidase/permease/ATPase subunit [Ectothiorhodospiraceae bacterium]|nr:NHLP family bacteriocin export ABC transporter peptidase/permease/ATPase subunit [Ectothiorhodospiraceae bacterium]